MAGACGALPDKAVKTISTVKLSGKRLLQLINDILDAAKMKQGTLVIKHEKVPWGGGAGEGGGEVPPGARGAESGRVLVAPALAARR